MAENKKKRRKTGSVTLSRRAYDALKEGGSRVVTWGKEWGGRQIRDTNNQTGIVTVVVAALTTFFAGMDVVAKNDFVRKYWWFLPGVLVAIGWMLRRYGRQRGRPIVAEQGTALLVAGVVMFIQAWRNRPKEAPKDEQQKQAVQQAKQAQKKAAKGETGDPDEAGAGNASNGYWMELPNGDFVQLPPGRAAKEAARAETANRMAAALFA